MVCFFLYDLYFYWQCNAALLSPYTSYEKSENYTVAIYQH